MTKTSPYSLVAICGLGWLGVDTTPKGMLKIVKCSLYKGIVQVVIKTSAALAYQYQEITVRENKSCV